MLSHVQLFGMHATFLCPSLFPEVCSNSCPLSWWCHPTVSFSVAHFYTCPQSFPASGSFSNESTISIRWPKYWSFSFSTSPSNEYWELVSFRIHWFDLLVVHGTLKSLLQHHSSKAPILQYSAFFMVQLSCLYVTTGKTIAFTRQSFVSKVMSLLLNMLSRFVIAFLPRGKHILIFWLESLSAAILELKKIKSVTVSTVSPSMPWNDGTRCHDLCFLNAEL